MYVYVRGTIFNINLYIQVSVTIAIDKETARFNMLSSFEGPGISSLCVISNLEHLYSCSSHEG